MLPTTSPSEKATLLLPFILSHLPPSQPLIIGLQGLQGSGKSALATALRTLLQSPPHALPTAILSIDDVYLPHAHLLALAATHPDNPLLQHRGQPSTHDVPLALDTLRALSAGVPTSLPRFDKGANRGAGERVPRERWECVNAVGEPPIRVVLFEGWCVGFRALGAGELAARHSAAVAAAREGGGGGGEEGYAGRLGYVQLCDVEVVNAALGEYEALTEMLDVFVHLDALEVGSVYGWRMEQERELWAKKGEGMSEEGVRKFVDGYYPAYELYLDGVRDGVFQAEGAKGKGRQVRIVVDGKRAVVRWEVL